MGTILSSADASFWGEEAMDGSGWSVAGAGDVNGDGYDEILIGSRQYGSGEQPSQSYLILGKASGWSMDTKLSSVDASFWAKSGGSTWSVAGAGDINSDGFDDILLGALLNSDGGSYAGKTYLIFGKDSGWSMDTDLSNADGSFYGENAEDRSGGLVAGAGDFNGDGYDDILIGAHLNDEGGSDAGQTYIIMLWQIDTDSDGIHDGVDWFPQDIAASMDTDGDGFPDYWNEGKTQADSTTGLRLDAFSEDIAASLDTDGDGFPDEWNEGMNETNSTTGLRLDDFPLDASASLDTDGDGWPNEWNPGMSRDDSTSDPKLSIDEYPDDPLEWVDTDGDGHPDNSDDFPEDPNEWIDTDGDGRGDTYDHLFPDDPDDAFAWLDTDGDGYGDNGDALPEDPLEWLDADGDGHGDNSDIFPNDKDEWADSDGDGTGDNSDAFPGDSAASLDSDSDGYPDEWNTGKTKEDSTTDLKKDHFPNDPKKWEKDGESPSIGMVGALMAILVVAFQAYKRRIRSQ
jgi:hypothetical protein